MEKETKQQNSTEAQMGYDTVLAPVDDINSECYGCEAGMCDICSLRDNWADWQSANYEPTEKDKDEIKEPEMVNKEILVCDLKCGWKHENPSEWHHYERATNGNLCKTCGRCSSFCHTETVRVPLNGY
jgi:hypothetical protein